MVLAKVKTKISFSKPIDRTFITSKKTKLAVVIG